jgi:SAM-dependent methyltransferase
MNETLQHHDPEGEIDTLGSYLYQLRIRAVLPHIEGRLLDVGCGTNRLVREYGNGVGIDVYQFGGADEIFSDTSSLPYKEGDFQTITILAALNHIPNRDDVLREMRRILPEQGKLIVTMIPPRISQFWHFIRKPWDRDQHERGMHEHEVYGFAKNEMRAMLKSAGFHVQLETPFMLGVNTMYVAIKQH